MEFSAQQIADFLKGSVDGNPDVKVHDFSKIEEGKPGTLTFLANPKYEHYIYKTKASLVLVNTDFKPSEPVEATLVRVENAYASLAMLLKLVDQSKERKTGINELAFISEKATVGEDVYIGAFAFIGEGAKIGNNCQIYPYVYIGDNVTIGDNCIIYPQVTIYHDCKVGKTCIFHAGSVIGSDGFGFAPMGERYDKIPQLGNVMIEDDVEIGANTTVDRAVMGSTIIHQGTKLDNLVQIAHNVEVGENTVMAAQVGIAGSTKIGNHCMFGGQVGLAGHIQIGNNVNFGGQAGVGHNVKDGQSLWGSPAFDVRKFKRSTIVFGKLPEMYREINQLRRELDKIKKEFNKE